MFALALSFLSARIFLKSDLCKMLTPLWITGEYSLEQNVQTHFQVTTKSSSDCRLNSLQHTKSSKTCHLSMTQSSESISACKLDSCCGNLSHSGFLDYLSRISNLLQRPANRQAEQLKSFSNLLICGICVCSHLDSGRTWCGINQRQPDKDESKAGKCTLCNRRSHPRRTSHASKVSYELSKTVASFELPNTLQVSGWQRPREGFHLGVHVQAYPCPLLSFS